MEESELVKDNQDTKENLVIEKCDTGVVEKAGAKDSNDDDDDDDDDGDDEKKSITEADGAAEQSGVAEVIEQPVPFDI